jgi:hypothetical protein
MKRPPFYYYVVLCVLGLCGRGPATGQEHSVLELERTLVVSGQGYFPVALRLQDGRIAVVLRGGADHLGILGRLDIVFSDDEGISWSAPTVVVDSPLDDRNPAFGQAADGTLLVAFFRTAQYDDEGRYNPRLDKPMTTWITSSRDGGRTWLEPRQIDVSDISWGSPYGRMLLLEDGSLLMAIYGGPVRRPSDPPTQTVGPNHSYIYRSQDHGQTWTRYAGPIGAPKQFSETALLRLNSGRIVAAMRSRAGELWLAESEDQGRTWSEPRLLAPRDVHPADLVLLRDGRALLVAGYRVGPYGVRGVVADDAGNFDWARHFVLVNDARSRDCGYPSSVLLRDGRVLTVYYATGSKEFPQWRVHCGAVTYRPPPR